MGLSSKSTAADGPGNEVDWQALSEAWAEPHSTEASGKFADPLSFCLRAFANGGRSYVIEVILCCWSGATRPTLTMSKVRGRWRDAATLILAAKTNRPSVGNSMFDYRILILKRSAKSSFMVRKTRLRRYQLVGRANFAFTDLKLRQILRRHSASSVECLFLTCAPRRSISLGYITGSSWRRQ